MPLRGNQSNQIRARAHFFLVIFFLRFTKATTTKIIGVGVATTKINVRTFFSHVRVTQFCSIYTTKR